jgi:hypothetical protein
MTKPMSDVDKVLFQLSGGFAGVIRRAEVVLADLPEPDRARLDTLLQASGLEASTTSARSARASKARDTEEIEIEIERGGKVTRHAFSELDLPETVSPLVDWLKKRARPQRPT